jgi:hypothetical protein
MRFKFKNGNTACSIEGQAFAASPSGVFTIPDALAPRVVQEWGKEIEAADAAEVSSSIAIEDMTREQLIETIIADGRAKLAAPSIEALRDMARVVRRETDAGGDGDQIPANFNPEAVTAEDIDTMPRAELFALLKQRGVKTDGRMSNDDLRGLAHDAIAKATSPAK